MKIGVDAETPCCGMGRPCEDGVKYHTIRFTPIHWRKVVKPLAAKLVVFGGSSVFFGTSPIDKPMIRKTMTVGFSILV